MIIVDRKKFLTMPKGTVYAKYKPAYTESTCVKLDNCTSGNDWFYINLDPVCAIDEIDEPDGFKCYEQMEKGIDFPFVQVQYRDGCFDQDQLFLIYADSDVESLIEALK